MARWLAAAIGPTLRRDDGTRRPFWDAFCGGLSVSVALAETGSTGTISDANPALVSLYQAVAAGWDPPSSVSEDDYKVARSLPDSDPRKAFVGFGCSFGGKWFGGYARNSRGYDYCAGAKNSLVKHVVGLARRGCEILHANFLEVEPEPTDVVLYLDPPYARTTAYGATGAFDYDRFYERVWQWAEHTDVWVSEYSMPVELGGRLAMEFSHDLQVNGGTSKDARVERLYHYSPATRARLE